MWHWHPLDILSLNFFKVWPPIRNNYVSDEWCLFPGFRKGKLMKCHWKELSTKHTLCKTNCLLYLCRFLFVFYIMVIFQNEQMIVVKWYENSLNLSWVSSRCKQTKCCPESVLGVQCILNILSRPFWKCTLNNLKKIMS